MKRKKKTVGLTADDLAEAKALLDSQPCGFSALHSATIATARSLLAEVERLQRIEAAAYAYREDGYLGTDGMRHHTPEAYADFDAAIRAAGSGE